MSSLLLLLGCAEVECPGGSVRGIAEDLEIRAGGWVTLSDWSSGEELATIQVSGYRRFEFLAVPAGVYAVQTGAEGCDYRSDHYVVEVCDGPVEVYPGVDRAADHASQYLCED